MASGERRVARNQKAGLSAIADTEGYPSGTCDVSRARDDAIPNFAVHGGELLRPAALPFIAHAIKGMIETRDMMGHN
jgi:hypothetical protein